MAGRAESTQRAVHLLDYSLARCSVEITMYVVSDCDYVCVFKVSEGWRTTAVTNGLFMELSIRVLEEKIGI